MLHRNKQVFHRFSSSSPHQSIWKVSQHVVCLLCLMEDRRGKKTFNTSPWHTCCVCMSNRCDGRSLLLFFSSPPHARPPPSAPCLSFLSSLPPPQLTCDECKKCTLSAGRVPFKVVRLDFYSVRTLLSHIFCFAVCSICSPCI